jgi:hypothetical protein
MDFCILTSAEKNALVECESDRAISAYATIVLVLWLLSSPMNRMAIRSLPWPVVAARVSVLLHIQDFSLSPSLAGSLFVKRYII